jgi:Zn-dependent membrane protease YugP
VYEPATVAAAAVAAHESGTRSSTRRVRTALHPLEDVPGGRVRVVAWIWLLLAGALLGALNLVAVALALYAVAVAFHLVTLPVEFNASRRASQQLASLGLVTTAEREGVNKVLTAAALTYVAGALAALTQLLYYLLVFFGNRD